MKRNKSTYDDKGPLQNCLNFLPVVKSSALILQFLVKNLIDLMNIKAKNFMIETRAFSPMKACNEVMKCYMMQARQKGVSLELAVPLNSKVHKIVTDR